MRYVDLETWEPRAATLQEHRDAMIVADALETLHIVDGHQFYVDLVGIPPFMVMLEGMVNGIRYSSKAQHFGYQKDSEVFLIKMAQELGIGLDAELDIAPPLTLDTGSVEAIYRYVEAGFGVWACPGVMLGATSPVTIAGTLVSQHAATAAFIVIAQLIKPGTPVMAFSVGLASHTRGGYPLFGSTEKSLLTLAYCQLYRKFDIPIGTAAGYATDSKKIDFQCGYEKAMGTLLSALGGSNCHIFHGGITMELTYNPVMAILDDDIAGWIGRFIEGFEVTDDTMVIDLINEVGPIPGTFLNKEHTRKWWVKERFMPKVADQDTFTEWLHKGKLDTLNLAKQRMEEILATHKPKPLTPHEEQVIENIMKEARDYYRKNGQISDEEWVLYMKTIESAD